MKQSSMKRTIRGLRTELVQHTQDMTLAMALFHTEEGMTLEEFRASLHSNNPPKPRVNRALLGRNTNLAAEVDQLEEQLMFANDLLDKHGIHQVTLVSEAGVMPVKTLDELKQEPVHIGIDLGSKPDRGVIVLHPKHVEQMGGIDVVQEAYPDAKIIVQSVLPELTGY